MRPHPNDDAWLKVPLFGALGYAILLALVLPQTDGSLTSTAAWLLLPTVIAIGLLVMLATSTGRRWGSRVYALAAPVTVLVLALGLSMVRQASPGHVDDVPTATPRSVETITAEESVAPAMDTPADPSTADPSATDPSAPDPSAPPATDAPDAPDAPAPADTTLVAPSSGDGWTRVRGKTVRAGDEQIGQWTSDLYGIDDVAVGSYEQDSAPGLVFRFVGVNGHIEAASPEAAGRASLVSAAGTPVVAFPADADGWLGCNAASAQGTQRVSCAWVGDDHAVFLRWDDATISMDDAAAATRAFRDHAES